MTGECCVFGFARVRKKFKFEKIHISSAECERALRFSLFSRFIEKLELKALAKQLLLRFELQIDR